MTLTLLAGLLLTVVGTELFLRGAAGIKRRLGAPGFMIGLVVVGFGTSLPEGVVALSAGASRFHDLALGLLVGSNIFNIMAVLGLAALLRPLKVNRRVLGRDGLAMAVATLALAGVVLTGVMTRGVGLALLGLLALYVGVIAVQETRAAGPTTMQAKAGFAGRGPGMIWLALLMAAAGAAALLFGAGLMIEAVAGIAFDRGVSVALLGLTVVAVVTSMPELVVSITAALRGEHNVAVSNVLGSNIINGLGILALLMVVHPMDAPLAFDPLHALVLLAVTAIFLIAIVLDRVISRFEGAALLAGYVGYIAYVFLL